MKARYWSLAIILVLVNYLIFATLFSRLMESDFSSPYATRTPIPTFTPAPAEPFIVVPTLTPIPQMPTATATRVLSSEEGREGASLDTNRPANNAAAETNPQPELVAPGAVNIRAGPALDYPVIGTLNANTARPVVGRSVDASWWQIEITASEVGWVSDTVVETSHTGDVPVVVAAKPAGSANPAPQPAASNPPPAPEKPKHQFTPTGWYDDTNGGVTRFLGDIKDTAGNPVNGVFVRATCGHYSTISFPSGPVGWGTKNESADWPDGFYDITVDERPVPCIWMLSIVETEDRKTATALLSEDIPVEVTLEKSVIIANWQKNW